MARMLLRCFSFLPLILLFSACGGDATGPQGTLSGTYALKTVNGSTIPVTFTNAGSTFRVNSGNIVINTGTTFSSTINYSETISGQTTTTNSVCTGTFTQNGNSVFFSEALSSNPDCGGDYTGSWSNGNTLTVAYDASFQAVYQK